MSNGYGAGCADVITSIDLKEICPKEYNAFMDALKTLNVSFDEYAQSKLYGDIDSPAYENVNIKFVNLARKFKKVTDGLELDIEYHNSEDNGDCYDEVSNGFFAVYNMYQLTKAGKKIGNKVERKYYVTWG